MPPEDDVAGEECPFCGDLYSAQGLPQHKQHCDENPENADATELVLVEMWTSYDHVVEYAKEQGFDLYPDRLDERFDDPEDIPRSNYYNKIREYVPKADMEDLNAEVEHGKPVRIAPTSVPRT